MEVHSLNVSGDNDTISENAWGIVIKEVPRLNINGEPPVYTVREYPAN